MANAEQSILVVDDEESLREGLSKLLEDEGYTVMCAETGEQALAILQEAHIEKRRLQQRDWPLEIHRSLLKCEHQKTRIHMLQEEYLVLQEMHVTDRNTP